MIYKNVMYRVLSISDEVENIYVLENYRYQRGQVLNIVLLNSVKFYWVFFSLIYRY